MKNKNIDYIFFDMDGTIANLYQVDNWLEKLRKFDSSPYAEATPMLNFSVFARILKRLQKDGYKIGIITWGSKESNPLYDEQVKKVKKEWLQKHLPSIKWDRFCFSEYGIDKGLIAEALTNNKKSILFDDNADIRNSYTGFAAYDVNNILEILKLL